MQLYYNPTDKKCKSIIGGITDKDKLVLTVYTNASELSFKFYCDKTAKFTDYKGVKKGDKFVLNLPLLPIGLYFYYIIADGKIYIPSQNLNATISDCLNNGYQLLVFDCNYQTPSWLKGGLIYQIFPDRFYRVGDKLSLPNGKTARNWGEKPYYKPNEKGKILNNDFFGGNFKGIESKAEYLKELGVTAVYLNPITKSFSNHRYDTANYLEIDEILGTEEDFKSLCNTLHGLGIKVILDGVFNHTGDDSIYFNKYSTYDTLGAYQGEKSKYYNWYTFEKYPDKYTCWWGIDVLPTINKNSEEFEDFIAGEKGVIEKYLSLGADGYRLDVVDELPPRFFKKIRKAVKNSKQDGVVIGEVWEDATNKIAYDLRREYFLGQELDSVMNYPLKNAIIDFIKRKDAKILEEVVLTQINNYPKPALDMLMNILGTHDTARILTVLSDKEIPKTREETAKMEFSYAENKKAFNLLKIATLLQFTLYGVPSVYYGDEIGTNGGKDPFNRTCFNWEFDEFNREVYGFYKQISAIRSNNACFKGGECKVIKAENGLFAFTRETDSERVLVCVNLGEYSYLIKSDKEFTNLLNGTKGTKFDIDKNNYIILRQKI